MTNETLARNSSPVDSGRPSRPLTLRSVLRDIVVIVLAALLVSFLIKTFLFRSFYIPTGSMENTLQINDHVVVSLLTPSLTPLKRGDVVVFADPSGWLPVQPSTSSPSPSAISSALAFVGLIAPDGDNHLIKRVIGLPGDVVSCCDTGGHVTVNGTPIVEPYVLIPPGETRADKFTFTETVPAGSLWVMGDNRYDSADSAYRYYHHIQSYVVPMKDVVGRAVLVNWPISRWAYLDDFPDVFAPVGKTPQVIVPRG